MRVLLVADYPLPMQQGFSAYKIKVISLVNLSASTMMTFVNVFTVIPDRQKDSLRVIQNLYREVVRHQPGLVSARLLIGDDGTRITAIALWESKEQLAAAKQISGFQDFYDSEFFEATINEAHVYSTFVEIPGVLHKHKYRSNFQGNLEE